jgi:Protein of unknown function (DUF3500)
MRGMSTRILILCLAITALPVTGAAADPLSATLADAAKAWLASLDDGQRAKAQFPFDSEERFNWFYIPRDRGGLMLKAMSPAQQKTALHVLEVGLSQKGYSKAEAIRALDLVLADIEGDRVRRDPEKYYLSIFGEPSPSGTWGMRWEGHHVSLHWTVVDGKSTATTPQFLGSNPAEVKDGPRKGTYVLRAEEDLARALVKALSDDQRKAAIISDKAPADILTTNTRKATIQDDLGLAVKDMGSKERGILMALIEEYAAVQPQQLAAERIARIKKAGLDGVKFAWMGGIEPGELHYYRVQGPTFLIELDNTQNNGNHIHSVWRDFAGDFGVDLLEEHYKHSPHHRDGGQ